MLKDMQFFLQKANLLRKNDVNSTWILVRVTALSYEFVIILLSF